MTDEMIEAIEAAKEAHAVRRFDYSHNQLGTVAGAANTSETLAAIKAYVESLAKAGLGIRPREPTPDQENAGRGSFDLTKSGRENCVLVWQAMWDAHPDKPNG